MATPIHDAQRQLMRSKPQFMAKPIHDARHQFMRSKPQFMAKPIHDAKHQFMHPRCNSWRSQFMTHSVNSCTPVQFTAKPIHDAQRQFMHPDAIHGKANSRRTASIHAPGAIHGEANSRRTASIHALRCNSRQSQFMTHSVNSCTPVQFMAKPIHDAQRQFMPPCAIHGEAKYNLLSFHID